MHIEQKKSLVAIIIRLLFTGATNLDSEEWKFIIDIILNLTRT